MATSPASDHAARQLHRPLAAGDDLSAIAAKYAEERQSIFGPNIQPERRQAWLDGYAAGFAACREAAATAALRLVAHRNPDEPMNLTATAYNLGCTTSAQAIRELRPS